MITKEIAEAIYEENKESILNYLRSTQGRANCRFKLDEYGGLKIDADYIGESPEIIYVTLRHKKNLTVEELDDAFGYQIEQEIGRIIEMLE